MTYNFKNIPLKVDRVMNDHDLLLTIQELLDGTEWQAEHLNEIAALLTENGYCVRDLEE